MAFLTRYRALRQVDVNEAESDEVEYNFGRAFHQLGQEVPSVVPCLVVVLTDGIGLHSLAVKHYERVLEIAEKKTKTNPDVGSSSNEESKWIILTLRRTLDWLEKPLITYL